MGKSQWKVRNLLLSILKTAKTIVWSSLQDCQRLPSLFPAQLFSTPCQLQACLRPLFYYPMRLLRRFLCRQAPALLDLFSGLGDRPLLPSGKQSASGLAILSHAALAPNPAIDPPATLKPLSGPNIVPPPTPAEQTASVLSPLSSPLMTSLFLAQGIPAPCILLSSAIVEPLAPSPAIDPPATLKPLSGPNIVPFLTPAKKTASILSPSSSLSMTFPLSAQGIPASSTFLSGFGCQVFYSACHTIHISYTSIGSGCRVSRAG